MRNVFQRPIFKLDNLDAQKDNLQNMVKTLLKEAKLKEDGLAWLPDQISVWMEMNLEKTGTFQNLEANYKGVKECKDIKASKTDILRHGKGEDWQKAIDIIIEEIRGKSQQQREGFEEQVGKWIEQGVCLRHQDELWILSCYRRSLLRKLSKIEDSENRVL